MKKPLLFLLPLIALVGLYLFQEPLFSFALENSISRNSKKIFGNALEYRSLKCREGCWTMRSVYLPSLSEDPERRFEAERIHFRPRWDWRALRLSLDVEVVGAKLHMGSRPVNLERVSRRLFTGSPLYRVDTRLRMEKGEVSWRDGLDELAFAEMHLDGFSRFGVMTGDFKLLFSDIPGIEMHSSGEALSLRFHETDTSSLIQAAKWFGVPFYGWKAKQGVLDGSLRIPLQYGEAEIESDLVVKGLLFEQEEMEVEAKLTRLKLQLHEERESVPTHKLLPKIIGRLEIEGEGALLLKEKGEPFWQISGVKGGIVFHPESGFQLQLDGVGTHHEQAFSIGLGADVRVIDEDQTSLDLKLFLKGENKEPAEARFMARQLGGDCNCAQIECKNLGEEEFAFLRTALIRTSPKWKRVHMHGGTIDASGIAYLDGFRVTDIQIDKLEAKDLDFDFDSLGICMKVEKGTGDFSVNLEESRITDTLNAHFSVVAGQLKLLGFHQTPWKFSDIHTEVSIEKGVFQESVLRGEFAGLSGEVRLNWTSQEEALQLAFSGKPDRVAELFPELISRGILKGFAEDHVALQANMKKLPKGGELQGTLEVRSSEGEVSDTIAFGFDLMQEAEDLWSEPERIGVMLKNGWFDGQDLSAAKYVAPFVFEGEETTLRGKGDFTGFFDQNSLAVEYDLRDVILENPKFLVLVHELHHAVAADEDTLLPAAHYFDFLEGKRYGFLPVKQGAYLEKNSGLWFTDIETVIAFDEERIALDELDTVCQGIYFAGGIDLDLTDMPSSRYSIAIHADTMSGRVSQVAELMRKVGLEASGQLFSLEGEVGLREKGADLSFLVSERDTEIGFQISGQLEEGTFSSSLFPPVIQEVGFQFDYDKSDSTLSLSDFRASLRAPEMREYRLGGEKMRFGKERAEFDVWIGDKNRDLLRISATADQSEEGIRFAFDRKKTHIGNVHPKTLALHLRSLGEVEEFDLELEFRLSSLFRDMKAFLEMGFLDLSPKWKERLNSLPTVSGAMSAKVEYHSEDAQLLYSLTGKEVVLADHRFDECLFHGRKKGGAWIIDQFLLDDFSFAADIAQEESLWKVNFLGAQLGDSILLGMEGQYREEDEQLVGKVNLLEVDLAKLGKSPLAAPFLQHLAPKGELRAIGELNLDGKKRGKWDALFTVSVKNCEMQGLSFRDAENFSCHLASDKRLVLRHLETAIVAGGEEKAALLFDTIDYTFGNKEIFAEGIHFDIPAEQLPWLAEELRGRCPDTAMPWKEIAGLKKEGRLQGILDLEMYPPHHAMKLELADGTYHFRGRDYTVEDLILERDPFESKMTAQVDWDGSTYWTQLASRSPELRSGELYLTESYPTIDVVENPKRAIAARWSLDPDWNMSFHTFKGCCGGLTMNLEADPADPETLIGNVAINGWHPRPLLPREVRSWVQEWQIGEGFTLNGHWRLDDPHVHFRGTVEGDQFAMKGYEWDHLTAHLEAGPEAIYFTDFTLTDSCGELHADHIEIEKNARDEWLLAMPLMTLTNFRPSLLRNPGQERKTQAKPLMIRQMQVHDLKGSLSDSATLTGSGSLHFTNRSRKKLSNTIFSIPGEVLSRIGLDLALLTPVTGTVDFDIRDRKMLLTRCKDIYSDKHLSKFYLPNNSQPYYIDFDGNIHVQVKMKQYNIVFKLAELFTVSVQGTLTKPTYSLQKAGKQLIEPVSRR